MVYILKEPSWKTNLKLGVLGTLSTIQRTNQAIRGIRAAAQPRAVLELLKIPHLGMPAPTKVRSQAAGCRHRRREVAS